MTVLRAIPVIDPADLVSDDPEVRREAIDLTVRGLHDIGFLFVRTPEVAAELPGAYETFRELFTLGEDVLDGYARPEIHHQRGYTPPLAEVGIFCQRSGKDGGAEPDTKCCWMVGPEPADLSDPSLVDAFPDLYAENVWPDEVPGLREATSVLRRRLLDVGAAVLEALEEPLGYPKGFFADVVHDSPTVLRALYYPPVGGVGACDHTDINYVTVLPAPTREGLWVKARDGEWIRGMAPAGCSLVQVGDMLQYTTGGYFHSAIHKVDAPTGEGRYSTALFVHARSTVDLRPAERWSADPDDHGSLTAAEFLYRRLDEIGLAKKEAAA